MANEVETKATAEQSETMNGTTSDAPATNGTSANGDKSDVVAPKQENDTIANGANGDATAESSTNAPGANDAADDSKSASAASKTQKRKSSSGVPEHKSKKNRRKSMISPVLDAQPGDHYWAKWKTTSWPAVIASEKMIPAELLKTRPVSAARSDGSYREDFMDGGKNVNSRQYCIMFLGENNFTWLVNTNLTKLDPEECAPNEKTEKMKATLQDAYRIATEKHDLEYFENIIESHQNEMREFERQQAEAEIEAEKEKEAKEAAKKEAAAAAAAAKPKKARKSKGAAEGDEMEVDGAPDSAAKPSKKRKKEADSEGEGAEAKKPAKVRLSTSKAAKDTPAKKTTKTKKTAPAAESGAAVENDDGVGPELKAQDFEKAILFLRHKLQKGFLSKEKSVDAEDMPALADRLAQLEAYPQLEPAIIRLTKIHKVLKGILKLAEIPRDGEFNISQRCEDLLKTWEASLSRDGVPQSAVEPKGDGDGEIVGENKSVGNGDAPEKEAAAIDKKDETETGDVTMTDAKDEKIAPGSEDKAAEAKAAPETTVDEDSKTLEANAGVSAA